MAGKRKKSRMFSKQNVRQLTAMTIHEQCAVFDPNDFPMNTRIVGASRVLQCSDNGCKFCLMIKSAFYAYCTREGTHIAELDHHGNCSTVMGVHDENAVAISSVKLLSDETQTLTVRTKPLVGNDPAIEIYISTGNPSPWPCIWPVGEVSGDTSSAVSLKKGIDWIQMCTGTHDLCNSGRRGKLPRRVLDINGRTTMVIESKGRTGRYACLSHCWGKAPLIRTVKNNIRKHKTGIRWNTLPKTFQHTISFLRKLKIQYVWIDSLCIVQDDAADWEAEAAKMASYYRGAYITLAATGASDSSEGLFTKTPVCHLPTEFESPGNDGISYTLRVRRPIHHGYLIRQNTNEYLERHPLLSRAWVYQERLLSARVLHFGPYELVWECRETHTCECERLPEHHGEFNRKEIHEGIFSAESEDAKVVGWRQVVIGYTCLSLTFEKDIFPAVSGLARQVQEKRQSEYLAGLWRDTLIEDLLWSRESSTRPIAWRAPSWSWASKIGPVMYHRALWAYDLSEATKYIRRRHTTVLEAECTLSGIDPFGQLSSGFLLLQGPLAPGTIEAAIPTKESVSARYNITIDGVDLSALYPLRPLIKWDINAPEEVLDVQCLRIMDIESEPPEQSKIVYFLILRQLSSAEEIYERVALMTIIVKVTGQLDHVGEIKKVKII